MNAKCGVCGMPEGAQHKRSCPKSIGLQGTSPKVKLEAVEHPVHYTQGGIECIQAIKAALTEEEFRGFCKGNALKYIWRERYKGGEESLLKAEWYLRKIE